MPATASCRESAWYNCSSSRGNGEVAETDERRSCSVTIVVVTYNSEQLLPDFFSSLTGALDGLPATVVVSDNASVDGSLDLARDLWPDAVIVRSASNRGYAAAINAAVAADAASSDGVPILVLNDDIRLSEGSVERLIEAIDSRDVGIAVPRLTDGDGALLRSLRREPSVGRAFGEAILGGERSGRNDWLGEIIQDANEYDVPTRSAWASGCAWMISRDCWDSVGEWDESLFLYAEDIDYALRAGDAGFALQLVPEARAVHLVGPSHENSRLWAMSVWNRYRVYRRRNGPLKGAAFWLALLMNESIRCAAGRKIHCVGASALLFASKRPIEVR